LRWVIVMRIERRMRHPVVTVKPRDSIRHAREIMEKRRVNQLPVVVDGALVGIVTDRDLRDAFPSVFEAGGAAHAAPADPDTILVEDVMTANVLTLHPEASIEQAARLMRAERIGAVPIVAGERLVGIMTRSDVLDAFLALADVQGRAVS
jgi:acetoin utilization protein AcuB